MPRTGYAVLTSPRPGGELKIARPDQPALQRRVRPDAPKEANPMELGVTAAGSANTRIMLICAPLAKDDGDPV